MDQPRDRERSAPPLSGEERRLALSLVRRAVELFVREGRELEPGEAGPSLWRCAGAFVTLTAPGGLRGCVGTVESRSPLPETLVHCAIAAATQDTRFAPVTEEELSRLRYEVSILSDLRRAGSPDEVQVGTHGILVESGSRRGLLLPQVAAAHRWDRETFLDQACMKAGLPGGIWRSGPALWVFTAEVFGEKIPMP